MHILHIGLSTYIVCIYWINSTKCNVEFNHLSKYPVLSTVYVCTYGSASIYMYMSTYIYTCIYILDTLWISGLDVSQENIAWRTDRETRFRNPSEDDREGWL